MEPCAVRGGSRLGEQLGKEFLDVQRPKAIFLCYLFKSRTFKQMQNKKKKRRKQTKKSKQKNQSCVCSRFFTRWLRGEVRRGGGRFFFLGWGGGAKWERSERGSSRTGCPARVEVRMRAGAAVDSISQHPVRRAHVIAAAQWERGGGRAGAMAEVGR